MSNYGIRGTVFKWFKNYLHNRKQYVIVNGAISSTDNIDCGRGLNKLDLQTTKGVAGCSTV